MPDDSREAFCKFMSIFSARLVQSLVQSRQEHYEAQPCLPIAEDNPQSEWFNLKIDELGEIAAHLKSSVKKYPPYSKLTVEFVLYTTDGRFLPLEAWTLRVDESQTDDRINLDSHYHSLSVLLRSVNVAARMTPMHRLYVKKQSSESFIIMYRIYTTDTISDMGENCRNRQLARLPSLFGTVYLDLVYRTSMHFDYKEKEEDKENGPLRPSLSDCTPVLMKSSIQSEPRLSASSSIADDYNSTFSTTDPMRISLSDIGAKSPPASSDFELAAKVPFGSLLQSIYAPLDAASPQPTRDDDDEVDGKSPEPSQATPAEIAAIPEEEEEEGELDKSEDSFIELCAFGSSSGSADLELGELLNSLKVAPDIQSFPTTEEEIQRDLTTFSEQKESFQWFIDRINKSVEEENE